MSRALRCELLGLVLRDPSSDLATIWMSTLIAHEPSQGRHYIECSIFVSCCGLKHVDKPI